MSGETEAPWLRLELISRPEAARLVRSMVTAAGAAMAFDPELMSDVNTAVSEACNNVILHAYADRPGPFSVELSTTSRAIEVRVRDRGLGISHGVPEHNGLKVGVALIGALADRAEFINPADGGTEVRLSFRTPLPSREPQWRGAVEERDSPVEEGNGASWRAELYSGMTGDVVLTVSPVALLAPVLGRIGRALAPSAGFSLQRCSDVYLLSDALGAHAERAAESSSISVSLGARDQRLEFALAPLRAGTSAGPQGADALARLSEEVTFSALGGHETLRVSMRDHLRA